MLLAQEGRRVLRVDADPQFALTRQLGIEERSLDVNLVDVLAGRADAADVTGLARRTASLCELGADEVIQVLDPDGPTYDVIIDAVGGATLGAAIGLVAPSGRDLREQPCDRQRLLFLAVTTRPVTAGHRDRQERARASRTSEPASPGSTAA